jgi:hypothetical protein
MTKVKILLQALEGLRVVRQQAVEEITNTMGDVPKSQSDTGEENLRAAKQQEITSTMRDASKSQSDTARENLKMCLRLLQEHEDQTSKLVQALSRI